jgi:hypothetical protein
MSLGLRNLDLPARYQLRWHVPSCHLDPRQPNPRQVSRSVLVSCDCDLLLYGWIGHKPGSGLSDRPRPALGVFASSNRPRGTGFELPSSCVNLPCYASNRNRSGLDFMRWPHIDLGAQDLNDIQRPKSFQNNSWK